MIWKTAWKNVWRNRVRSFVVIASVTVGVFAAVFMIAIMNGMIAQRISAALNEEISHIQISGKGFRLNNDPMILIPDHEKTISLIKSEEGIAGFIERTLVSGMAATAVKSAGVQIAGIDPEKEKSVFSIYKTVMAGTGSFFESKEGKDLALIGHDLAKELSIVRYYIDSTVVEVLRKNDVPEDVLHKLAPIAGIRYPNEKKFNKTINSLLTKKEVITYGLIIKKSAWSYREGSRLTLTFLDKDNNQVGARFRIAGIYDLKNSMFEQSMVFVRNSDLARLTGLDSGAFHQIIIKIKDVDQTENITGELRAKLPQHDVMNWREIQPDLAMLTDYVHQMYAVFMLIILAALAFGIVNTMLMVVLERTRELGMLTAIGMNRRKVFTMIMLESVFLSLTGGLAGMFLGWLTVRLTAEKGINFAQYAEGMEAYGYSAHLYPEIGVGFLLLGTVLIILTGIASSVYPAIKALKLNPVEAIRTE